jgi:hypothetical protein
LILPINDSISLTLDQEDLSTTTTIEFSERYADDELWLNGEKHELTQRVRKILRMAREKAHPKFSNNISQERKTLLIKDGRNLPSELLRKTPFRLLQGWLLQHQDYRL